MRAFVRLLPRLLLLAFAAAALLVLAERERSAHADALPPRTTPGPSADPAPPPFTTPPPPAPPPRPPHLVVAPPSPPQLPVPTPPSPPIPTLPTLPPVDTPAPPGSPVPAPPELGGLPGVPEAPGTPFVDAGGLTGIAGPLAGMPEVEAPEPPLLPELPAVPDVPNVPPPLDRVLELVAAPASGAPAPAGVPDRPPSTLVSQPAPWRVDPGVAIGVLVDVDAGLAPARAPPDGASGSAHPCPGGGSPHPTRTDPAAFPDPATRGASRGAGLLAEARVYTSTSLRDPLLRPD